MSFVYSFFDQTCIISTKGWRSTTGPPDLFSSFLVPVRPPDATKPVASSHYFTPLYQVPAYILCIAVRIELIQDAWNLAGEPISVV